MTLHYYSRGDGGPGPGDHRAFQILRAPVRSAFSGQRLRAVVSKERTEDLEYLTTLIEEGKVTPVIDRTFPLREVPEAIRYLAHGHPGGKIVVTV